MGTCEATIEVDSDLRDLVHTEAERSGMSPSAYLRRVLDNHRADRAAHANVDATGLAQARATLAGMYTGVYGPTYLDDLRTQWAE